MEYTYIFSMNKWKLQERKYNNKELKTSKKNQLKKVRNAIHWNKWKYSGSKGTPEKVVLFFRFECSDNSRYTSRPSLIPVLGFPAVFQ